VDARFLREVGHAINRDFHLVARPMVNLTARDGSGAAGLASAGVASDCEVAGKDGLGAFVEGESCATAATTNRISRSTARGLRRKKRTLSTNDIRDFLPSALILRGV